MSPEFQIIITFAVFLVLLTCGMAVPFAIAIPAVFYLLLQGGLPSLNSLGLVSWGSMNSFVLTCVPLFMLMAEILRVSGLSNRIYAGLAKLVARLPGGLLQTNIAGCAIFASVSGSSIATAASIGGVALPQLISRKYDRRLAAGSLAAGGTLGILLPPSFGMIVYGTFTETSVPKLFMAGVAPGLIMTAAFMTYIGLHAANWPSVAPREPGPRSLHELIAALVDVLPFGILIAGTLGGIYAGLVTTTEGATIGCILAIVLGATCGDLTFGRMIGAMYSTIRFSGNILFIIFTAYIFSYAISFAGVGEKVTAFIVGLQLSRLEFFLSLLILYTVLGCLIESLGMIVPYIDKAFGQKGSTVLASYTYPLQFIWGRKKIESLDDIKGMKLRVAQPEQGEFVRRFGGTSITMSAPEVPSALDRGVVDGIFTAGVGAVLWKDLLKYGYVLIINVNNSYFIANTEAYNKLSPDLQAKLRDVAQQSARWDQDTMQKEEAESVQILTGMGYTFTKAKPEEVARAIDTMKPYWEEWAKSRGPDVVEALAKTRTALGR